jgi:DNA-binding GntR family transcriptional regulator
MPAPTPPPMSAAQIVDDLTERIAAGDYGPPHTQMPTYQALSRLYSVGFGTIARVFLVLRERGVVYGLQGKGTFVAEGAIRESRS